jgi:PhnB protein
MGTIPVDFEDHSSRRDRDQHASPDTPQISPGSTRAVLRQPTPVLLTVTRRDSRRVSYSTTGRSSFLWEDDVPPLHESFKEELMATKPTPQPIPDAYRRVTPTLVVDGGVEALEFYTALFGATERMRIPGPGGTIAHAEIQVGDSVLMIEDASPALGTKAPPPDGLDGSPTSLFIYVEDVDAVIRSAVELGATLQRAPQDQFYGDRDGHIVDPFGHHWTVATHVEDVPPDEMMRRIGELYGGEAS